MLRVWLEKKIRIDWGNVWEKKNMNLCFNYLVILKINWFITMVFSQRRSLILLTLTNPKWIIWIKNSKRWRSKWMSWKSALPCSRNIVLFQEIFYKLFFVCLSVSFGIVCCCLETFFCLLTSLFVFPNKTTMTNLKETKKDKKTKTTSKENWKN